MNSAAPSLVAAIEQAERLWRHGDAVQAFDVYKRALPMLMDVHDPSSADVVALERFADLGALLGQTDVAEQALLLMASLCEEAGNAYGEDYALLKAALVMHQSGRIRRALALVYSRDQRFGNIDAIAFEPAALERWEAGVRWPQTDADDRAVLFALFYLAVSRLAASLGQYGDAAQAAKRGAVHASRNVPLAQRYRIPLMLAEALAAVQSGAFRHGAELLDDVAQQADAKRDPGLRFQLLELSAKLAMLRGNLGAALDHLQKTVDLAGQWPSSVQAASLENLASFEILINQTAHAAHTLDQAETHAAPSDVCHIQRIAQLRAMADLRARSYAADAPGSVFPVWERSDRGTDPSATEPSIVEAAEQPGDFLGWFEQRTLGFQLALGEGRLALAADLLATIHNTFAATDSEIIHLRVAYLDALLAYYRGRYEHADAILSPLLPLLERSELLHDTWQARRLASWIARRMQASDADVDRAITEESRALDQLGASLDVVSRAIFMLNKWTADEEAIASLADAAVLAQSRPRARFAPIRWWRTLQNWRAVLAVENRLEAGKRTLAESTVGTSFGAVRLARFRDVLWGSSVQAHLTFSALPDRLVAIVRSRGIARIQMLDVSRIVLRQGVKAWHERMLDAVGAPWRSDPLSSLLAALVADLPAAVRELRLRPDDALHGYPFAALRVNDVAIVERYTISLGHESTRPPNTAGARAAVVIAADQPIGDYIGLPNAAVEAVAVGDRLSQSGFEVRVISGGAARKTDAIAALGNAALVHIACHGQFQADQPSRTGLVLAGPDGSPATLSITDIGAIDGSRLEHVTLSACWSADNFVVPGRWIFSLPETLCRTGARSVLACLWEADDRVASSLMQRFYANLARMSRAESLRDAQLACLRNQLLPGSDTSDPILWAGFYLFGESRSLPCH
jgi:hypothetical protein